MKAFLTIFLGFALLPQSQAQDLITLQGKNYFHGTKWINKSDIKQIIQDQGDPVAIRYYSNYQRGKEIGIATLIAGAALNIVGYSVAEKGIWAYPVETTGYQIAGTVLYGVGGITLIVKKKSLINAINRFNSVQQQKTNLELGITREGIGLGLRF